MSKPTPSVVIRYTRAATATTKRLPRTGRAKSQVPMVRAKMHVEDADGDEGQHLAQAAAPTDEMGVTSTCSRVPISRSLARPMAVTMVVTTISSIAITPGIM